jgi:hypothetical protein
MRARSPLAPVHEHKAGRTSSSTSSSASSASAASSLAARRSPLQVNLAPPAAGSGSASPGSADAADREPLSGGRSRSSSSGRTSSSTGSGYDRDAHNQRVAAAQAAAQAQSKSVVRQSLDRVERRHAKRTDAMRKLQEAKRAKLQASTQAQAQQHAQYLVSSDAQIWQLSFFDQFVLAVAGGSRRCRRGRWRGRCSGLSFVGPRAAGASVRGPGCHVAFAFGLNSAPLLALARTAMDPRCPRAAVVQTSTVPTAVLTWHPGTPVFPSICVSNHFSRPSFSCLCT